MFTDISVDPKKAMHVIEIDRFLQLPVEDVKDPLAWWVCNSHVYPNLLCMALDYLSIPGVLLRHLCPCYHILIFIRSHIYCS
jgi:hypothetical protein